MVLYHLSLFCTNVCKFNVCVFVCVFWYILCVWEGSFVTVPWPVLYPFSDNYIFHKKKKVHTIVTRLPYNLVAVVVLALGVILVQKFSSQQMFGCCHQLLPERQQWLVKGNKCGWKWSDSGILQSKQTYCSHFSPVTMSDTGTDMSCILVPVAMDIQYSFTSFCLQKKF